MKGFRLHYLFSLLLLLAVNQHGAAQIKNSIVRSAAFYRVQMPGTQLVDENGTPVPVKPIITHTIILETTGNTIPVIDSVFYKGETVTFDKAAINASYWDMAVLKATGKKAGWPLKKNNHLWRIEFIADNTTAAGNAVLLKIKGKLSKKNFSLLVKTEVELEPQLTL